MKKNSKSFIKNFFKLSIICLVFFMSCGKKEAQKEEPAEWYTKLGLKEVGKQMKKNSQLLTRRLGENSWEEAIKLGTTIGKSFEKLDLSNSVIPEDFYELKQSFDGAVAKLLLACQDKDGETVKIRLEIFKKACHHCHVIFRKKLDASNKETDFDVAVDKLYKDK